jgi:hypothetical protein
MIVILVPASGGAVGRDGRIRGDPECRAPVQNRGPVGARAEGRPVRAISKGAAAHTRSRLPKLVLLGKEVQSRFRFRKSCCGLSSPFRAMSRTG